MRSRNTMRVSLSPVLVRLIRRYSTRSIIDDWFVIAITDANFGRYFITPEELKAAINRNPKVHTALICIGEGAEASWYVVCGRLP